VIKKLKRPIVHRGVNYPPDHIRHHKFHNSGTAKDRATRFGDFF